MNNIEYNWDSSDGDNDLTQDIEIGKPTKKKPNENLATRSNLQIMRRLFHMLNGSVFATLYLFSFSHSQMIHILGTIACALYLVEQVRINYPEKASKLIPFTKFIMRAEEQLKESAMVPYAMAVLLTVITFPKAIALVGIYTLAFADPLSAIFGIKYGKHKISENRSWEGTGAFFISTFVCSILVLSYFNPGMVFVNLLISVLLGMLCSVFDLIPLRIDDNLTIPLFTSLALWCLSIIFGINFLVL